MTPQPDHYLPHILLDPPFYCERNSLYIYPYERGIKFCLLRQKIAETKVKWPYHFVHLTNAACDAWACVDCNQGRALRGLKPLPPKPKQTEVIYLRKKRCVHCQHSNRHGWCHKHKSRGNAVCDDFEWREGR